MAWLPVSDICKYGTRRKAAGWWVRKRGFCGLLREIGRQERLFFLPLRFAVACKVGNRFPLAGALQKGAIPITLFVVASFNRCLPASGLWRRSVI